MQRQLRGTSLRWTLLIALAVLFVSIYGWRLRAQPTVGQPPDAPSGPASIAPAVTAPVSDQGASNALQEMGGTYHFLEARATRMTTRFRDGSAVADRGIDGALKARLVDSAGNEVVQLRVMPGERGGSDLVVGKDQQVRLHTKIRPEVQPTLDWITLQAYAVGRDDESADVEWQGQFLRSRGLKAGTLDDQVQEASIEFEGGITATTSRPPDPPAGQRRPTTLTLVQAEGIEVGRMLWFAQDQRLVWKFPGLTEGMVDGERLKKYYGGWSFVPTTAWANVQGLAFYRFQSRVKTQGVVAQGHVEPRGGNWLEKIGTLVAPTLHANTAGCDGLHWLDHTIFRPCCDTHDICYYKTGCTSASWWYWPVYAGNWVCSACNGYAVGCFASTITTFYPMYWYY
jgi:hypothetical protein